MSSNIEQIYPVKVDLEKNITTFNDGQNLTITFWCGADGKDCDPEDAIGFVCGPSKLGLYYPVDLSKIKKITMLH